MGIQKTGALLRQLRQEHGMTQKEVAEKLYISDKAVSKWECGQGLPDVSLLEDLSKIYGVHIEKILAGDLSPNETDGGNMKRIKFYACPTCGNIITATGTAEVSCCGRALSPLAVKTADAAHTATVETVDSDYYITFSHEMRKEHFLAFVAYVHFDRVLLVRLYPEQNAEVRLPYMGGGELLWYCTTHGLMQQKLQ